MPLSLLDLPEVRAAVSDLYRILEDPRPANDVASRVYRWSTGRTTLGEQSPDGMTPVAFILAGMDQVMFHFGGHTKDDCPEITGSNIDLKMKSALLNLRGQLLLPFAAYQLANNDGVRIQFLTDLEEVLARITPATTGGSEGETLGARGKRLLNAKAATKGPLSAEVADKRKGCSLAEAEVLVRNWLKKNAKRDPSRITRDGVAAGLKAEGMQVSTGTVSKTAAWIAFKGHRDADKKPGARDVPLSDQMLAVIPSGNRGKALSEQKDSVLGEVSMMEELIREQKSEWDQEERRHGRRHRPS